ncbi:unnamed protein product, partial [marine sediment metagenome]
MSFSNTSDHTNVRITKPGQCIDLATAAGTQLEHREVVEHLPLEDAQRHADMIVEISWARRSVESRGEHLMNHLPR